MRALLVGTMVVACGGDDMAIDAGLDATPRPDCDLIVGGFPACNDVCPWDCERGDSCQQEVCVPAETEFCSLFNSTSGTDFCSDSNLCATDSPRDGALVGTCLPEEFCAEAETSGLFARCFYSDFTPFVEGPPVETECPAPPHPTSPFCGGPCGGCPAVTDETPPIENVGCIGRNEDRGIGVCVFTDEVCTEDRPLGFIGRGPDDPPVVAGVRNVACLVYQGVPVLEGRGWLTRRDACLAYRDRYPGAVDCLDHNWESFP